MTAMTLARPTAAQLSLDPMFTDDVAAALTALAVDPTGAPAPYHPSGAIHFDVDAGTILYGPTQDDLTELGAAAPGAPRKPYQAIKAGRQFSTDAVFVGVGMCLKTIRTLYGVGPVWPDATTGWENADQRHPTSDPMSIPRGVPVWWVNPKFGHVALSIGGGFCLTTDYRRTGFVDVAPIAALGSWCGGRLAGWSETINGVDVWDKKKPVPKFDLENQIGTVRKAIKAAKAAKKPDWKVQGLERWRDQLVALRPVAKKK